MKSERGGGCNQSADRRRRQAVYHEDHRRDRLGKHRGPPCFLCRKHQAGIGCSEHIFHRHYRDGCGDAYGQRSGAAGVAVGASVSGGNAGDLRLRPFYVRPKGDRIRQPTVLAQAPVLQGIQSGTGGDRAGADKSKQLVRIDAKRTGCAARSPDGGFHRAVERKAVGGAG